MDSRLAHTCQIRTANSVSRCSLFFVFLCNFYTTIKIVLVIYFRAELDDLLSWSNKDTANSDIELRPSIDVYHGINRFLSLFREKSPAHCERLERLCRYLLASLESENPKFSYIGVALNKELSIAWIRHIKLLLYKCCVCMENLKPGI